jgi:spore germination protein
MDNKLNSISMVSFIVHGVIGMKVLYISREIVIKADNNSWISIILGAIIVLLSCLGQYYIGIKNPGLNTSQIIRKLLGPFFGNLLLILGGLYTLAVISLFLRIFGDATKLFLLDRTPLYVIISLLAISCLYGVSKGIRAINVVLDMLLPIVLLAIAILVILPIGKADIRNLLPVFHDGFRSTAKGLGNSINAFFGFSIVGYVLPYFIDAKSTKKWIFVGFSICAFVYLAIVLMSIMVFGTREIYTLVYPTITLTKTIQLRVQLFERAESIFMAAWIPNVFTSIILYYFISTKNLMVLLKTNKERLLLYIQCIVFIILSLIPADSLVAFRYINLVDNYLGKGITLLVIPILVILQIIKERRKALETKP